MPTLKEHSVLFSKFHFFHGFIYNYQKIHFLCLVTAKTDLNKSKMLTGDGIDKKKICVEMNNVYALYTI